MLVGGIVGWERGLDDLFNPHSFRNRDDCLEPFRVLRSEAYARDIQLHTFDVLARQGISPDFNLYIESVPIIPVKGCKNYLVRFETELTVPINGDPSYLKQFDGIYTWDSELLNPMSTNDLALQLGGILKFPITYPNVPPVGYQFGRIINSGFLSRTIFCTLIGSNRHPNTPDPRELYSERVKAIRWFESHSLNQFSLFGNGWLVPQKRFGKLGKLQYRLEKILPYVMRKPIFPSYQGVAKTKFEIYSKSRFAICFENARDIPGYITEKIFDCLFAGCLPIYWGEPAIEKFVPKSCFIDFKEFLSQPDPYGAMYSYINNMNEMEYIKYQEAGRDFLSSSSFASFSSKAFAESILRPIQS